MLAVNPLIDQIYEWMTPSSERGDFSLEGLEMAPLDKKEFFYQEYKDFILDSLSCEYGYVINIDTGCLEFYQGYQHEPQEGNRYGTAVGYHSDYGNTDYYPCRFCGAFSFRYLREMPAGSVIRAMEKMCSWDEEEGEDEVADTPMEINLDVAYLYREPWEEPIAFSVRNDKDVYDLEGKKSKKKNKK